MSPPSPRTIAVIAVRMGSQRLPGKVLRAVAGKPLLGHLLDRAQRATTLDGVVVATPESAINDAVADYCSTRGVPCFRGSEEDVSARILGALEREGATVGVMLYGDGPLMDPRIIDTCVEEYRKNSWDWVGNDLKPGCPSGLFVEAFSVAALRDAMSRCTDPAIREHGTLCLRQDGEHHAIHHLEVTGVLQRPDIYLTVDTDEDMTMMEAIFAHFASRNDFGAEEIIAFLDAHPDVARGNQHIHRRWKKYQQA